MPSFTTHEPPLQYDKQSVIVAVYAIALLLLLLLGSADMVLLNARIRPAATEAFAIQCCALPTCSANCYRYKTRYAFFATIYNDASIDRPNGIQYNVLSTRAFGDSEL